jgi:hypothetical protein
MCRVRETVLGKHGYVVLKGCVIHIWVVVIRARGLPIQGEPEAHVRYRPRYQVGDDPEHVDGRSCADVNILLVETHDSTHQ